jgi:uncharacterized protein involved in type VI secretion and phage assembly
MTTTQPATRSESRAIAALTRALQDAGIEVVGQHRETLHRFYKRAFAEDGMVVHYGHLDQKAVDRVYRMGARCAWFAEHTADEPYVIWRERRDTLFRVASRMQRELDAIAKDVAP